MKTGHVCSRVLLGVGLLLVASVYVGNVFAQAPGVIVTLTKSEVVSVRVNGRTVGNVTYPSGTALQAVGVIGDNLIILPESEKYLIPMKSTDHPNGVQVAKENPPPPELAVKADDEKDAYHLNGTVLQVSGGGILLNGYLLTMTERRKGLEILAKVAALEKELKKEEEKNTPTQPVLGSVDKQIKLLEKISALRVTLPNADETAYYVDGVSESLADGEKWKGMVYYAGRYQYVAVSGGKKTVRRFATSRALADKLLQGPQVKDE